MRILDHVLLALILALLFEKGATAKSKKPKKGNKSKNRIQPKWRNTPLRGQRSALDPFPPGDIICGKTCMLFLPTLLASHVLAQN